MNFVKLIAEIGINHDGSLDKCKKLIDGSCKANCEYIKFQYRNLNRTYISTKEIGDEILSKEIKRCYLRPKDLLSLNQYGKSLGLKVGISFFCVEDIDDFKDELNQFEFFKVPSPEMNNFKLIDKLLENEKLVFCSTGAHDQIDIDDLNKKYSVNKNFVPMHCVSNYPLEEFNSIIGYVKYLKRIFGGVVGYSSHDKDQVGCIVAAAMGADFIERHVTIETHSEGLDHSTSSSINDLVELSKKLKKVSYQRQGDSPRKANQGEIINLQNLGRSYYSKRYISAGEILVDEDFEYRSPRTGIGFKNFQSLLGCKVSKAIEKGEVLGHQHILKENSKDLNKEKITINDNLSNVSIPVRLHDIESIRNNFKISNFECHLSFGEVFQKQDMSIFDSNESYTIHVPDYISSTKLIDPFSKDESIKLRSRELMKNIKKLGEDLYYLTNKKVVVVGSFSVYHNSKEKFYSFLKEFQTEFNNDRVQICYQILPPFAWYFGGSVKVNVFDSMYDYKIISKYNIPICIDLSHLLMSSYFYNFDPEEAYSVLEDNAIHFHISGAEGLDGEGKGLSSLKENEHRILKKMLKSSKKCVVEIWQGHLNGFNGFKEEISYLNKIRN